MDSYILKSLGRLIWSFGIVLSIGVLIKDASPWLGAFGGALIALGGNMELR